MTLKSISSKEAYEVTSIEESDLKYRLYEMGLYPKQMVQLVQKAPLGDPIVVQVDGQLIMLRNEEAELITIEKR